MSQKSRAKQSERDTEIFLFTRFVPKVSEAVLRADKNLVIINPTHTLYGHMSDKEVEKIVKDNFVPVENIKLTEQYPSETECLYDTRMNFYEAIKDVPSDKKVPAKISMAQARVMTNELLYGTTYAGNSKGIKEIMVIKDKLK